MFELARGSTVVLRCVAQVKVNRIGRGWGKVGRKSAVFLLMSCGHFVLCPHQHLSLCFVITGFSNIDFAIQKKPLELLVLVGGTELGGISLILY